MKAQVPISNYEKFYSGTSLSRLFGIDFSVYQKYVIIRTNFFEFEIFQTS